jgi:hypothetical protein
MISLARTIAIDVVRILFDENASFAYFGVRVTQILGKMKN